MASELNLPEGVTAVYDRDFVVVKVIRPRGAAAETETEAGGDEEAGDGGEG